MRQFFFIFFEKRASLDFLLHKLVEGQHQKAILRFLKIYLPNRVFKNKNAPRLKMTSGLLDPSLLLLTLLLTLLLLLLSLLTMHQKMNLMQMLWR